MSIEDLMKPRYKVIAPYPLAAFPVGVILHPKNPHNFNVVEGGYWVTDLDRYPHLFKPLAWWEEREEKDMPQYVKATFPKATNPVEPAICKARFDFTETSRWWMFIDDQIHPYCPDDFLPATAEEYEQYIKQKQK